LKDIRIDKGLELLLRNKRKGINVILGSENATIYGHMTLLLRYQKNGSEWYRKLFLWYFRRSRSGVGIKLDIEDTLAFSLSLLIQRRLRSENESVPFVIMPCGVLLSLADREVKRLVPSQS
jgi:hypothetical protein